jgi:hypothetical protein
MYAGISLQKVCFTTSGIRRSFKLNIKVTNLTWKMYAFMVAEDYKTLGKIISLGLLDCGAPENSSM